MFDINSLPLSFTFAQVKNEETNEKISLCAVVGALWRSL